MTSLAYVKIGAVAVAVLVLSGAGLWLRSVVRDRDRLRGELADAVSANQAAMETVRTLRAQAERDSQASAALTAKLRASAARALAESKRLADAAKGDPDVRAYLAAPVPAGLRCVLSDEGCDQDGNDPARPAGGAPGPVQPSGPEDTDDHGGSGGRAPVMAPGGAGVRGSAPGAPRLASSEAVTAATVNTGPDRDSKDPVGAAAPAGAGPAAASPARAAVACLFSPLPDPRARAVTAGLPPRDSRRPGRAAGLAVGLLEAP